MVALNMVDDMPLRTRSLSAVVGSLRLQLLLCLVFGLLAPALIYSRGDLTFLTTNPAVQNSIAAGTVAIIVGLVAIRKFGEFPGTISASYVVPSFAATYGVVIAAFLLMRAPYSGVLLSASFMLSLAIRFAVSALDRRPDATTYYLVPGGQIDRIRGDIDISCITLNRPGMPQQPSAVIVADLHHDHSDDWERAFAMAALNGIGVYHYKQVWEAKTGKVRIEHLSENSLGSLIPSNSYAKMKRLLDILLSLAVLPVLLLPLIVVALLIRFDSPGPVFFRQERIGHRGRSFHVLKFRTMRMAEPQATHEGRLDAAITKDDDQRITRLGRFLRKTRIDELPQIWNILRSEMSWIGPRPEARPLSEWYEREIPFYSYRHIVRPGITGWAQVNQGHVAGISEVHDKLRFDFYYIKNFSMWIDLIILFKTVMVVIRGSGAK